MDDEIKNSGMMELDIVVVRLIFMVKDLFRFNSRSERNYNEKRKSSLNALK